MTPFTTIGVVSMLSTTSVWKIQAGRSLLTFEVFIWRFG
jgi:hypothetical protein